MIAQVLDPTLRCQLGHAQRLEARLESIVSLYEQGLMFSMFYLLFCGLSSLLLVVDTNAGMHQASTVAAELWPLWLHALILV